MAIAKSGRALGKNEKILLGTLMVLTITFIYWTLLLQPALNKIQPLEEEVKVLKSQIKNTSTIKSNIEEKESQLVELRVQYEEATKVVSKTDRYPELVKEIRELANMNNLKIVTEGLGAPTVFAQAASEVPAEGGEAQAANPAEGLKTMAITLSLEGDFNNALAFINKLEEDKRILEVQSFNSTDKTTTVNLMYYIAGGEEAEEYDFNTGSYGKDNLFN